MMISRAVHVHRSPVGADRQRALVDLMISYRQIVTAVGVTPETRPFSEPLCPGNRTLFDKKLDVFDKKSIFSEFYKSHCWEDLSSTPFGTTFQSTLIHETTKISENRVFDWFFSLILRFSEILEASHIRVLWKVVPNGAPPRSSQQCDL